VAKALEKFKRQKLKCKTQSAKLKIESKKLKTIKLIQLVRFVGIRGNSWLKLLKKSKGKTQN
jgi:hypothetical protein